MKKLISQREVVINDSPIAKFLFSDSRFAWVWLVARLYVAYSWLTSGVGKLSNPGWIGDGSALKGFWQNALKVDPKPVISFDWYRTFIQYLFDSQAYTWFSKLVVAGELAVGFFLLVGAFTGLAALVGGFMNWNFMMAGTASVNPMLFILSVLLFTAWKTAGYWGMDRYLLPLLGTPWRPGFQIGEPRAQPA
ncbi:MAG: DoxX family protein [Chloroflexi bacterium]|nr:DoxX family protein [Chloroflexota bacterium]